MKLAAARHRQEMSEQLTVTAIASQGSGEAIKKQAEDLNKDH